MNQPICWTSSFWFTNCRQCCLFRLLDSRKKTMKSVEMMNIWAHVSICWYFSSKCQHKTKGLKILRQSVRYWERKVKWTCVMQDSLGLLPGNMSLPSFSSTPACCFFVLPRQRHVDFNPWILAGLCVSSLLHHSLIVEGENANRSYSVVFLIISFLGSFLPFSRQKLFILKLSGWQR